MRPMNSTEREDNESCIVSFDPPRGQVRVHHVGTGTETGTGEETSKTFTFDKVYDETSTQRQVFDDVAKGIIDSVIQGFNGTIFCYGQTVWVLFG